MNDEFQEIDNFIQFLKDEEEMNNYINKDIYPEYLRSSKPSII